MNKKYGFEASIASVLFIILFFVMVLQIFGRTPLISGPIWTEELARWIWVWMALIGIGTVERDRAHLSMGFLVEYLPSSVQKIWAVIVDLVYIAIACHLVWIAYKSILRTWNNETVTLPTTDAVLYASAFVAMILIVHRVARRLVENISNLTGTRA
ncbi:TRAP transporter small permease [Aliiroseovarius sp. PrR006]|uniref:TRAP transporter small permease n=1 Tax=Aliiroseovarius sp. PrR006 TaxID=2706883 RepID=UPI0013D2F03F|nr:TRAP transporter small permease [Aliiroseovarius sp. PrR006]NDW54272.1 TRAP transporter small permease [Aliiroseovarius sp. PrR006]